MQFEPAPFCLSSELNDVPTRAPRDGVRALGKHDFLGSWCSYPIRLTDLHAQPLLGS